MGKFLCSKCGQEVRDISHKCGEKDKQKKCQVIPG